MHANTNTETFSGSPSLPAGSAVAPHAGPLPDSTSSFVSPDREQETQCGPECADIGLLGMWMTCNYGAVLTSYALYRTLERMGKKVSLLDFSYTDRQRDTCTVFRKFLAREKLSIVPMHNLDHAYHLNDRFDTFMVGSDQVWNPGFMGHLFFLDFVRGEKRKIAYGPSMAQQTVPRKKYLRKSSPLLKRFDAISVREQGMVSQLRRHFNCESTWVMDPVFLHDREQWLQLAEETEGSDGAVVSYILDPTDSKRSLLLDASARLGAPLLNMVDIQREEINNRELLNLPNTLEEATLYNWLGNIARCRFFVTDSYHGVCFALIFNKPFICIDNPLRGSGRFLSLLDLLHLRGRMLPENAAALPPDISPDMDYEAINAMLRGPIEQSRQWLQGALSRKRPESLENYCRATDKKLTRRPPSRWQLVKRKGRRLLAGAYHRLIRR